MTIKAALVWIAAALALAIREHALPFVLLLGAIAAWRGDWRQARAWALLNGRDHVLPEDIEQLFLPVLDRKSVV